MQDFVHQQYLAGLGFAALGIFGSSFVMQTGDDCFGLFFPIMNKNEYRTIGCSSLINTFEGV